MQNKIKSAEEMHCLLSFNRKKHVMYIWGGSALFWQKATYLLNGLRCDDCGDSASLLHDHTLLMACVHLLPMQVTGGWLTVRLHTPTNKRK